mmetsp:Transcript_13648/g.27527  ORF Transcript_13648/g.27527 Transcript_13648/m.27527 type:complete len:119 (-) Transcript_13648:893-1249(-)
MNETDVRKAMLLNLAEWSINKNFSEQHRAFHNKAVTQAVESSKQMPSSASTSTQAVVADIVLSKDYATAIRQVLSNELETAADYTFWDAHDSLGFDFSPFFHKYDKNSVACSRSTNLV